MEKFNLHELSNEEIITITGGAKPAYYIGYYCRKWLCDTAEWISENIANGPMHS